MIKSYKIRLIPTEEQERLLWLHVDAMRFVWNWGLALNMERFKQGEKILTKASSGKILTELKNSDEKFAWLHEVSVQTLAMGLIDLDNAYTKFFSIQKKDKKYTAAKIKKFKRKNKKLTPYDMNGHPKFKSRYEVEPKFYTRHDNMYFLKDSVVLEKIGKVRYKTNYDLPVASKKNESTARFINPRIKYVNTKWILSFGIAKSVFGIEHESVKKELNDYSVGIDLGVKDLAVVSYNKGEEKKVFKNINKTKKIKRIRKRLKQKQRNVSRKYYQNGNYVKSKSILKEETKVKQLHRKLTNIRHNYTHHVTSEIINLNPSKIVIEDLNISGMMKNKYVSEAIQQQNLHEFRRQIEYKAEWAGIELIYADRFYPSSKKCSVCGAIKRDLRLKDRVYKCSECGLSIDRDLNAAKNLEKLA
jgi:putative transposase